MMMKEKLCIDVGWIDSCCDGLRKLMSWKSGADADRIGDRRPVNAMGALELSLKTEICFPEKYCISRQRNLSVSLGHILHPEAS